NTDKPVPYIMVSSEALTQPFPSPDAVRLGISLPQKYYQMEEAGAQTPRDYIASWLSDAVKTSSTIIFATPSASGTPQPLQLEFNPPDVTDFMTNGRPGAYGYKLRSAGDGELGIVADLGNDYW